MDEPAHDLDVPARARLHDVVAGHVLGSTAGPVTTDVSDRLLASWRRSEHYGVSLEAVDPSFTGTVDDESLFYACGREVLQGLQRTLAAEPVGLMLTDADGLVLNRYSGDHTLLAELDKVHLAPGFSYAEREAGTNGLGLALADLQPTLVRAEEHYSSSLCAYTCAAAPVFDPVTGILEGSVNLTTWSSDTSELLLALAQLAAGNTSALMLARSRGSEPRPEARGEVFRIESGRRQDAPGSVRDLSPAWERATADAAASFEVGRVVFAVGESGSGRATALAQALRTVHPRRRILAVSPPAPHDVDAWLSMWAPELGKADTAVVICDVDALPSVAADRIREAVVAARHASSDHRLAVGVTARHFEAIPEGVAELVDAVVEVAPLRDRREDVLPLARHATRRARGRDVDISPAAAHSLQAWHWPGNVDQLVQVVRDAATRTDRIDLQHLPAEILSGSSRRLSRIEAFERDEIIRVLTQPGTSMAEAAELLGMSRATVYRKVAHYDIRIPRR